MPPRGSRYRPGTVRGGSCPAPPSVRGCVAANSSFSAGFSSARDSGADRRAIQARVGAAATKHANPHQLLREISASESRSEIHVSADLSPSCSDFRGRSMAQPADIMLRNAEPGVTLKSVPRPGPCVTGPRVPVIAQAVLPTISANSAVSSVRSYASGAVRHLRWHNRPGEADGGWRVGICLGAQAPQLTSVALCRTRCEPCPLPKSIQP